MGAVERGGNEIAPVIFVSPGEQMPFEGAVVDEVSLGIHERAHFAALENPAHFQNVRQIAVIFAVSVDFPLCSTASVSATASPIVCVGRFSLRT